MTYYGQVERLQYQLDFLSEQKKTFTDNTTIQLINDGYNDGGTTIITTLLPKRTQCSSRP